MAAGSVKRGVSSVGYSCVGKAHTSRRARRAQLLGSLAGTLVLAALLAPLAPAHAADGDGGAGGVSVWVGAGVGGSASSTGAGGDGAAGSDAEQTTGGGGGGSGVVGGDGGAASTGGGAGGGGGEWEGAGGNDGEAGGDNNSGGGGGGGVHGFVGAIGDLTNSVTGGTGGNGGAAGFAGAGGGGGGGGFGAVITDLTGTTATIDAANVSAITGGTGGGYGWAATGGNGGSGLVIYQPIGDNTLTIGAALTGGNGGSGINASNQGGNGASGFVLNGATGDNSFTFEGTVSGGAAGSGASIGANGGAAILLTDTSGDTTLVIKASVTGGAATDGIFTGGIGGAGIDTTGSTGATTILVQSAVTGGASGTGSNPTGGAGITGANLGIILDGAAGSIIGGTQGTGTAAAIAFTGGTNVLEMRADGSGDVGTITGAITGADGDDILVLGGSNNASVDFTGALGTIAASGFGTLEKAGTSTWTVTDGAVGDGMSVLVSEGTLALTGGATLAGATRVTVYDTLDLSGLTSGTTLNNLSGAMSATIAAGATDLTLNQTTAGSYAGSITGAGTLTKTGSATLTLSGTNDYTGGTVIEAGTLAITSTTALPTAGGVALNGDTAVLDLSGAGTLDFATIGSLSGTASGAVVALGTNSLKIVQDTDGTYAGGFSVSSGDYVIKLGSATLTLTGSLDTLRYIEVRSGELALRTSADFADGLGIGAGVPPVGPTILTIGLPSGSEAGDSVVISSLYVAMQDNGGDNTLNIEAGATLSTGDFWFYGDGSTTNVINISGDATNGSGVLATDGFARYGGVSTMNLDGGVLRANKTNANFMSGFLTGSVTLEAGGGTIDSNGYDIGIAGVFTGTGALVKQGAGTLTLSGANSHSGGTVIEAGTLEVTNADALGTGAVNLSGSTAVLELNNIATNVYGLNGVAGSEVSLVLAGSIHLMADSGTYDYAGSITGGGGLSLLGSVLQMGNSTQILSGANNFTGYIGVIAGTLVLANDEVASSSNLVILADGAQLTIDAVNVTVAGLQNSGGGLATVLIDGGSLTLGGAGPATFAGTITGTGALIVDSTSTQTLTGVSDYTGGTTILAGTLALAGGGALASSGALALDGDTAVFDIVDANNLVTIGALSGTATGATLALGNQLLTTTVDVASVYAGAITGTGSFTKEGDATLTLNGISSFDGLVVVADGKLVVGDSSHADASIAGEVFVADGGTLGGIGTTGAVTVASGGTLSPGNSIGTLHVTGDVTFMTGSTYQVELAGNGTSDLIVATGAITISGATLNLVALDPEVSYVNGQSYTILEAAGGVTGSFAAVTTDSIFLRAQAEDFATGVNVVIGVVSPDTFTSVAATPNQYATAAALGTLPQTGASLALYNSVLFLTSASEAQWAYDQLSGEVHASTQSLFMEQSSLIRGALNDRLRAAQGGVGAASGTVVNVVETSSGALAYAAPSAVKVAADMSMPVKAAPALAPVERFALWSTAFGNWGDMNGNSNAAGVSDSTGGFLIGADTLVGDGWRLGVAGGYSYTDFSISGRNSSGSSDNWHIGLYGGNAWGPLALRTGLAYTWQDVSTNRSVAFTGYSDSLSADYDAGTVQAFGELGYRIDAAGIAFEPFANLSYVSLHQDGYTEEGGAAALTGDSQTMDTTFTTLGLRLAKEVAFGSTAATLRGALGWRHAFGDIDPTVTQAFAGSSAFTVTGAPIAEDAAVVEAGLDMLISPTATLGIAYTGQYGDGVSENGVNARLSVRF